MISGLFFLFFSGFYFTTDTITLVSAVLRPRPLTVGCLSTLGVLTQCDIIMVCIWCECMFRDCLLWLLLFVLHEITITDNNKYQSENVSQVVHEMNATQ